MRVKFYLQSPTRILIAINCALFFYIYYKSGISPQSLLEYGANFKPLIQEGEWWRLFTAMFLHAGFIHLFVNMYSLLNLGGILESLIPKLKMLLIYIITGIMASLFSFYLHDEPVVGVGASGAIFGLFGAFTALVVRKKIITNSGELLTIKSLRTPLILNFFISLMPEVDLSAHLGGFISGFIMGLFLI